MSYNFYNPNPYNKLVGDCVIRAICKALNKDWDDTYISIMLKAFEIKDMPSANYVWSSYLIDNGFKKYTIPDTCPDCYSIKDFCRDYTVGTYILATGTHVVTAIDGDYFDTWDSGDEVPLYYFERRK